MEPAVCRRQSRRAMDQSWGRQPALTSMSRQPWPKQCYKKYCNDSYLASHRSATHSALHRKLAHSRDAGWHAGDTATCLASRQASNPCSRAPSRRSQASARRQASARGPQQNPKTGAVIDRTASTWVKTYHNLWMRISASRCLSACGTITCRQARAASSSSFCGSIFNLRPVDWASTCWRHARSR